MDGQLGGNEENSVVPRLMEQFLDSLTDESKAKYKAPIKVSIVLYFSCPCQVKSQTC